MGKKIVLVYSLLFVSGAGLFLSILTGSGPFSLIWFGITGFLLGLRHGLDADHLAMIDNITRKLGSESRENSFVGTFFAAGHSVTVTAMALVVITLANAFLPYEAFLQILGVGISAGLLYVIAFINILILANLIRVWKRKESFASKDTASIGGLYSKIYGRLALFVSRQWQMLGVGMLFGVAFDTVSEVGALSLSALLAHSPFYAILPVLLFDIGVITSDTTDGFVMKRVYTWSMMEPLRRLFYNINLTATSVILAVAVGTLEILQVTFGLLRDVSFTVLGIYLTALILGIWGFSYRQYRIKYRDSYMLR